MKKLMFAAAVVAGMGAFALESANVVGYENASTEKAGFRLFTPMFQTVGAATYDIQDLIPSGNYVDGQINLQTLDANGNGGDVALAWWGDGWYDSNDDTPSIPLKKGDAVWLYSPDNAVTVNCSGEVSNAPIISDTVAGFVAIGNPYPVSYDIQDLIPLTAEGDPCSYVDGQINLQTLDANGNGGDVALAWWGDGWYDSNDDTPSVLLNPGEAVWLYSPDATLKIKWQGFSL